MSEQARGWRLLLTRPAEDCRVLAASLAEQGMYASCLPVLEMQALSLSTVQLELLQQLEQYDGIFVVSKPAAYFLLERLKEAGCALPQQPRWFTVGAATAAILRDAGLSVNHPQGADDSEALLTLPEFRQALTAASPKLLIVRADEGREWLAEYLRGQAVQVDYLALYRRQMPHYPDNTLWTKVQSEQLNALVVSSGQGLLNLQQLAGEHWPQLAQLPLFVPSERVAQLAQSAGVRSIINCYGASAAALQAALKVAPLP